MVNYTNLKALAIRSFCKTNQMNHFTVNLEKLNSLVDEIGLEAVSCSLESKKIAPEDMFPISLFFKGGKLEWMSDAKEYTILTFVLQEAIDDRCRELIDLMKVSNTDDPELDKTKVLAEIIANYPCYYVIAVAYKSNEPRRFRQLTYETKCRCNLVAIARDNYGYSKPEDDTTEEESSEETDSEEETEE